MLSVQTVIFDLGGVLLRYTGRTPLQLDEYVELDHAGLAFVVRCKERGLRLLILSNCSDFSLERLKRKFPQLFSLFAAEDIFIPSVTGYMKPERASYEAMLEQAGMAPEMCLFIDDSPVNVAAACNVGLCAITHTDWPSTEKTVQQFL